MGRLHAESMLLKQGSLTLDSCSLSVCGGEGAEAEQMGFQTALSLYVHFWTPLAVIVGAFQVEVMMEAWVTDAIVPTPKEHCKLIFGLTGRSVILLDRGTSEVHLASISALHLLKLVPALLLLATWLKSRMWRICYMNNQHCMGDVDCCWWVLQGFVIWRCNSNIKRKNETCT